MLTNLFEAPSKKGMRIIQITGGEGLRRRLVNMGIREGTTLIKLTPAGSKGPVVVKLGNTQIALGRGMAFKILVDIQ